MATQARRFANHPGAKEAPEWTLEYRLDVDKNPTMKGLPLVLASKLVTSFEWLQKLLWENAKFGEPRYLHLEGVPWRAVPNVIPLALDPSQQTMLPFEEALITPQSSDLPGRFYSAADYHALYRSGKVTPLQVAEALLPLIQRGPNESKYAAAWTHCHPEEVLAAAEASTERWARGQPLSVLDGVPFGVKDDVDVEGFVSSMGMRVDEGKAEYFRKVRETTSWPVRKLIEAGAVLVGKMNQHEVGMDTTGCNPSTGTATNWYNKSYYPGGSSSGAGSALCAGLVPIAVGTDAGGSIRIPASFCGVYGLKPTHNRTVTMSSSVCVIGPMAGTVADLTIAYRLMSQPNPDDPGQNLFATSQPPAPDAKKVLGICREWVDVMTDPKVKTVFDKVVTYLITERGYEVVDIKLPFLREGQVAHAATCLSEAAADARSRADNPNQYLSLLNHPNRILISTGAQTSAPDYLRYGQIRQVIMSHLAHLFQTYPGLMILTPTTPMAGWPIHPGELKYGGSDGNKSIKNMMFVWYANVSGCPAVTCPAGYIESVQGEGEVPVGVMAMGEWGMEEELLTWAGEMEGWLTGPGGGRKRPGEWVDVLKLVRERKD